MLSPAQAFWRIKENIKKEWKVAFFACFLMGILIHMPVLTADIPNHDGLDSMYFDQNMITSGRWFLTVACGFSSYFTLPWLIGLLGLAFLSCGAAGICEILDVRKTWAAGLVGGLMASFPALASTFAYVFTMDGYMLALLLAILAVLFTKKWRLGFLPGALCLAFSMGTYQAYLPFAMILSVFAVLMLFAEPSSMAGEGVAAEGVMKGRGNAAFQEFCKKLPKAFRYLYMGVLGAALYYVILQVLLKIQGKELADYQGINGMVSGGAADGIVSTVVSMYKDFLGFTLGGNVLYQNVFGLFALVCLVLAAAVAVIFMMRERKWWKNPLLFVIIVLAVLFMPVINNVILLISPNVTYHLLMRYQWVLYLIGGVALAVQGNGAGGGESEVARSTDLAADEHASIAMVAAQWLAFLGAGVLIFTYGVTDNIAYSNLQKKYEKTYAYCLRLLDRIEQTDGYYQGIPIAMVGVVGEEQYPHTDLTGDVTSNMIGMSGDGLLYTGDNYSAFMKHYLGATLNILPAEVMAEVYYSEEYMAMDTFPGENSIRIMDGVMYIKTENTAR